MQCSAEHIINQTIKGTLGHNYAFCDDVFDALHVLLNGNYHKYNLDQETICSPATGVTPDAFHNIFSSQHRKEKGIYYTPMDVCEYIVCNTIMLKYFGGGTIHKTDDFTHILNNEKDIKNLLYTESFFDPTSGAGDFLLAILNIKLRLSNLLKKNLGDVDYLNICKTLHGNDLEQDSVDIAKLRLFLTACPFLSKKESFVKLAQILNANFYNYDFVIDSNKITKRFDYIVGNPPYVEYGKYAQSSKITNKYGNIYANIMENSLPLLNKTGAFGLIVPLSYISTNRMAKIRQVIENACAEQIILSYADRPDCLFVGAHQKINIVFAKKAPAKQCRNWTSNYTYWYKSERSRLLGSKSIVENIFKKENIIPKIGNDIETSIYSKISSTFPNNLVNTQSQGGVDIYLNMRACFWIKAFFNSPGSKEYKKITYPNEIGDFILCLLNSSAFWIFWIFLSDCWHITAKELQAVSVPCTLKNANIFKKLAKNLLDKLEDTKVYVGTAQTEFEYKHKLCKSEIDDIDSAIAKVYNFTTKELDYIKSFALKYRIGDNNDS